MMKRMTGTLEEWPAARLEAVRDGEGAHATQRDQAMPHASHGF